MRGVAREASEDEARLLSTMIAYQAGELDGFTSLYAELASDLERFFAAYAGAAAAEDLVQDTFLEIHRSRRSYRPPLPVRPWVFGLARNVLRRHRRSSWRRRRREHAALVAAELRAETPSSGRPRLDAGDLHEALRRLPTTRREAWVLHHKDGWSFQEIARRMSIGVNAARLRASRAMRDLRRMLGGEVPPVPPADGNDEKGDPRA
jgi:RNA polymerase sigma-70 factor, ECF subfamily